MREMATALALIMAAMFVYERFKPARSFPPVRLWWLRATAVIAVQLVIVESGGLLWDTWFARASLVRLSDWGIPLGSVAAFLFISFISYWQHRFKHRSELLWRYFHQIHHAPARVELLTSFYRNPFEILLNMIVMSLILYSLLGTGPVIARNVVFLMGLADLFYHWNIRTPVWLGYIIQRPEAHCIHHLSGVHAYNYGDIPLWDMLFGTYRNVREFQGTCGFGPEADAHFFAMLRGHDLSGKRLKQ